MNVKTKRTLRNATISTLGAFVAGALLYTGAKKTDIFDYNLDAQILKDGKLTELNVPAYNPIKLEPFHCSRYVRMVAKDVYKMDYSYSDAWNRAYNDKLVAKVSNNEDIAKMALSGEIQPGYIVGIRRPNSKWSSVKDQTGKEAENGHNAIYLGLDESKRPLFSEQNGVFVRIVNLDRLTIDNHQIVNIIKPKN